MSIPQLVLLISSIIVMGLGVHSDRKLRKFPNQILLSIFIIGIAYGIIGGHILESIFGFIVANVIGVLFYKHHIMASGDMKFLSTIFLYISVLNIPVCLTLIGYMLLFSVFIGYFFYKRNYDTKEEIVDKLKGELASYKMLFMYRTNTFHQTKTEDFNSREEMLQKTIPFTLPMYLGYVATVITVIVTGGTI